jgi:hypothetical protein
MPAPPRRGYQAAGRTAALHDLYPERRDDARQLATTVHESDTRGLRRDYLETRFCLDGAGPGWTVGRFKAALFYAYGRGWVCFIGFTYVVDPGPGPSFADHLAERDRLAERAERDRAACSRGGSGGQSGIFDISMGTTTKTGTPSTIGQQVPNNTQRSTR